MRLLGACKQSATAPACRRSKKSAADLATSIGDAGTRTADAAPTRVLVADDNVANQRVLVRMLEGAGIRADVAGTGSEAVEMLRLINYDLVLMDCQMPVMTGHQA